MSRQVTIEISDEVASRASRVAEQTRRRVEDVLLQSLTTDMPVEDLPDSEVLALADLTLALEQQYTLSELLGLNSEDQLDGEQKARLDELIRLYEHGLLRKSQALRVAVKRGLREPLQA